ncbi:MAG: RecX family transcriptional regulator, partial [Patescibacteria group bacterium]
RTKYVGPRYLRAKLKQKGVGEDIIREVLGETFSPPYEGGVPAQGGGRGREAALAKLAVDQWKRTHPQHAGDRQRLYRFLLARGFSIDLVTSLVAA